MFLGAIVLVPNRERFAARQMDAAMATLHHIFLTSSGRTRPGIALAPDRACVTAKNEVDRRDHGNEEKDLGQRDIPSKIDRARCPLGSPYGTRIDPGIRMHPPHARGWIREREWSG